METMQDTSAQDQGTLASERTVSKAEITKEHVVTVISSLVTTILYYIQTPWYSWKRLYQVNPRGRLARRRLLLRLCDYLEIAFLMLRRTKIQDNSTSCAHVQILQHAFVMLERNLVSLREVSATAAEGVKKTIDWPSEELNTTWNYFLLTEDLNDIICHYQGVLLPVVDPDQLRLKLAYTGSKVSSDIALRL